jgi:hypothetical protein
MPDESLKILRFVGDLPDGTMAVAFDSKGTVMSVKECAGGMEVSVVSEKTQTSGKMDGVLGETFGGLGKYIKRYSKDK